MVMQHKQAKKQNEEETEWLELFKEAKQLGCSLEDIKAFISSSKEN